MAHNESYPELLEELRASRERNIRLSVRNEELECMIAASQENEKIYHPQASVAEMMRAFGQEARRTPAMIEDSIERELTAKLVLEEALEFVEALGFTVNLSNGEINLHGELPTNLVEAVDAIGDILVVTYGAANRLGIRAYPIFQEVQRSNMSKVGPDGKIIRRKGDGKVLKPETYFPPDVEGELRRQGWNKAPLASPEDAPPLQPREHAEGQPEGVDGQLEPAVHAGHQDTDTAQGEDNTGDDLQSRVPATQSISGDVRPDESPW
jgi:predicted HAD superfamily Cof-like phosphohydrolase